MLHLLIRQHLALHIHRLVKSRKVAEAHYGNGILLDNPCQGHLTHLPSFLLCQILRTLDYLLVNWVDTKHRIALHRFLTCGGIGAERSCEKTTVQWRPWDQAYASLVAVWVHFALFFPVAKTVVILH